jgi:hypothetical protein
MMWLREKQDERRGGGREERRRERERERRGRGRGKGEERRGEKVRNLFVVIIGIVSLGMPNFIDWNARLTITKTTFDT